MKQRVWAGACLAACLSCALVGLALVQPGTEAVDAGTRRFEKRVVASGLEAPWEVTWGPDEKLWVTERAAGRVVRIDPLSGEHTVAITIDEVTVAGGQSGLLGMALHPDLMRGTGHDHVYVAYTYTDRSLPPDARVVDEASPFRFLHAKVVRLRFQPASGRLEDPVDLLTGLPAGNDHSGLRMKVAADRTLHVTIGDQGGNQLGNFCNPVLSQRLPTADEVQRKDWSAYEGKTLRLSLDGSIPADNPPLAGVVSHVYTYGHRNPQGLAVGPDGTLYASDHGPKTDDEVNVLTAGGNYGWPHVAGYRDDQAYEYARWADATTPCASLRFSDLAIHPSVPREPESAFRAPMVEPLATLFTVAAGYDFEDPACGGVHFLCWPTVAASSVEFYGGHGRDGIPGWDAVLLVSSLKRGSIYVVPLDATRRRRDGRISRELWTANRYRDIALHPDGRTIFVATDVSGMVEAPGGGVTRDFQDRGAILAFTYAGEGHGSPMPTTSETSAAPTSARAAPLPPAANAAPVMPPGTGSPPSFTRAQVEAGRVAYDGYCAVCHGSTLTNGTFGTPLAGEYFRRQWSGRSVAALYEKSRSTMPPALPASLPAATYADILAYVLEVNGVPPGHADLPADQARLATQRIP